MTRPFAYRWIVAWLSIAACTPLSSPDGGRQPIACEARAEAHTKGTGETLTSTLQTAGIGLFAWHTYAGTPFGSGATEYLTNRHFTYDGGSGTWLGSAYWPFGSWLSFFAYAPYRADVSTGALVFPSGTSGGYPTAGYTVASAPSSQEDLVFAAPVVNRGQTSGNVPLVFTHALTQVVFKARWTGEEPFVRRVISQGLGVRITSIALENVRGSSFVTFYSGGYNWDSPAAENLATYATETYSLTPENGSLAGLTQAASALPQVPTYTDTFLLPAGVLYLIPQTLCATSRLRVTYGIYASGNELQEEFEAEFEIGLLDQHTWPAGGVFTYSLTLSLGGAPSVEAEAGEYRNSTLPGSEAGEYVNRAVDGNFAGSYADGSSLSDET